MTKHRSRASVRVRRSSGGSASFGGFLKEQQTASGLPVTRFVELIGLSRAAYYLLLNDEQVPTLSTVATMLSALEFEDIAVASPSEQRATGDDGSDLQATKDSVAYGFVWPWNTTARRKALEKYATTAGVAMATGTRLGALGLGAVVLHTPVVPFTLIAAAAAADAWTKARQRASGGHPSATRPTKRQLVEELTSVAESMTTEQLDALLGALEQVRRPSGAESAERMTARSEPLVGKVVEGTKLVPAIDGLSALKQIVETARECLLVHEEEATNRTRLRATEETEVAAIKAAESVLRSYFDQEFAERCSIYEEKFTRLDRALDEGNNQALHSAVAEIVDIAKNSPLADIGDLAQARAALDDPHQAWEM